MKSKKDLVIEARDLFDDFLISLPNVVGTGIVSEDIKKPDSKRLAVAVYVSEKKPKKDLQPNERIPEFLEVNVRNKKRKVPVRVIEQGQVTLERGTIGKEPL